MSNASPFVEIDGERWTLTLAPDSAQEIAKRAGGGDGQGKLIDGLQRIPLAAAVLSAGKPRKMDHIHLGRFYDTDFCQWHGRAADGYHYPIGAIMQIVRVSQ